MPAAKLNFATIEQGATYEYAFKWLQPDETPVDMSNCTARMQIRSSKESPTILVELTTENGGITIDVPTGRISFYISKDDTTVLTPIKGAVYDLEIVFVSKVIRLCEGKISISGEVTR